MSQDGSLLLTGQQTGLRCGYVDVAVGKMLARFDGDYDGVSAAALQSVDNQAARMGHDSGQTSTSVELAGEEPKEIGSGRHSPQLMPWLFLPDGKHVACGSGAGIVSIIAA